MGNEKVFETIFRRYYSSLCSYAFTIIHDLNDAEEVVQDVFLKLWEKHQSIKIHASLKSYLYRAVHNSCLNRLKHQKVKQKHDEHWLSQKETVSEDASKKVREEEIEKAIHDAIEGLPEQCKAVFMLSRFEHLTYAEIADNRSISVKTVENHMIKALRILREKLKDFLPLLMLVFINS